MRVGNLPKYYESYPTNELLALLEKRMSHQSLEGTARDKLIAVSRLAREYCLTPEHKYSRLHQ